MNLEDLKDLLPKNILEIADIIGYPATLKLVDRLGGVTFPFSKGVSKLGKARVDILVNTLGKDDANKLMAHFGGEDFYVPRCASALLECRNRKFIAEFDELKTSGDSALMALTRLCPQYGITDRFAWTLLSKYNRTQNAKQDSLF